MRGQSVAAHPPSGSASFARASAGRGDAPAFLAGRASSRAEQQKRPRGAVSVLLRRSGRKLARLDATAVRVAAVRARGCVAPVALDLPALGSDGDEAAEGPGALVGVLVSLPVVPGVELRVGQHLAELVPADVRQRGKALAVPEVGRRIRVAAGVAVEVEEEPELHLDAVDRSRAVPRAV